MKNNNLSRSFFVEYSLKFLIENHDLWQRESEDSYS